MGLQFPKGESWANIQYKDATSCSNKLARWQTISCLQGLTLTWFGLIADWLEALPSKGQEAYAVCVTIFSTGSNFHLLSNFNSSHPFLCALGIALLNNGQTSEYYATVLSGKRELAKCPTAHRLHWHEFLVTDIIMTSSLLPITLSLRKTYSSSGALCHWKWQLVLCLSIFIWHVNNAWIWIGSEWNQRVDI